MCWGHMANDSLHKQHLLRHNLLFQVGINCYTEENKWRENSRLPTSSLYDIIEGKQLEETNKFVKVSQQILHIVIKLL